MKIYDMLKKLCVSVLKGGIVDRFDRGNLWIVPGFTILTFIVLWATKFAKIAFFESTCDGGNMHEIGAQLEAKALEHCRSGARYYVAPNEGFSEDLSWRRSREVKNPEWILWFWAPILILMYVLPRFMWSLLLETQGINFGNVLRAAQTVTAENEDGITAVDKVKLSKRLDVIAENFRGAHSSRAFSGFMAFKAVHFVAPLVLLFAILPLMLGSDYRTWGFDIIRAWWNKNEWQGAPLMPFFDFGSGGQTGRLLIPLFPRYTMCDFYFFSHQNWHAITYQCYLNANWHERTALCTWIMLAFLSVLNFGNLVVWLEWAIRMVCFKEQRKNWVLKKWLNPEDFSKDDRAKMPRFAENFSMSQLLLFYYIEAHSERAVSSAFCTKMFSRYLEKDMIEMTTPA